jgi:superfamily I DNA and/or RNA helicase
VVLAGEHHHLPPTIKNYDAARQGLAITLMERIVCNQPEVVTLLKVQYRMNDAIIQFSSKWFYDGKVESAPEVTGRSVLDLDTPMMWIDTSNPEVRNKYQLLMNSGQFGEELMNDKVDFSEQYVGENHGRINKTEAELTLKVLSEYIEKIGRQRFIDERFDVGIISPYKVQTQYLRSLVKRNKFFKPFRSLITINTVDGFQGQERDIMLISLVRSNENGQIGFLSDLRRMNVAITRARMKLIIIGDVATLSHHPFYRKLYEYVGSL